MNREVQYITTEEGEQVGVLIDMDLYRRLVASERDDPELLLELTEEELRALAESKLAPVHQARLDELLVRQKQETLSAEEAAELDQLLAQVDQLNILKTRARYTLRQLPYPTPAE